MAPDSKENGSVEQMDHDAQPPPGAKAPPAKDAKQKKKEDLKKDEDLVRRSWCRDIACEVIHFSLSVFVSFPRRSSCFAW